MFSSGVMSMGSWFSSDTKEEKKIIETVSDKKIDSQRGDLLLDISDIEQSRMIINEPRFIGGDSPRKVSILKLAIDELVSSDNYKIILSKDKVLGKVKYAHFSIFMDAYFVHWGENSGYNLNFYIKDGANSKILRKVSKSLVPERRLLYESQVLLYRLIYSEDFVLTSERKKKLSLLKKKIVKVDSLPLDIKKIDDFKVELKKRRKISKINPIKNEENERSKKRKKKDRIRVPIVTPVILPPGSSLKSPEVSTEDEEAEDQETPSFISKSKNKKQDEEIDTPEIKKSDVARTKDEDILTPEEISAKLNKSLSKEILAIEEQLDQEEDNDIKEAEKVEKENKSKKRSKTVKSNIDAKDLKKIDELGSLFGVKFRKSYSVGVGVLVETIESTDIISVTNNFKHFSVNAIGDIKFIEKNPTELKLNIKLTKTFDSGEFNIPGITHIGFLYLKRYGNSLVRPILGFDYETQTFVNLSYQGEGLQVNQNSLFWYKVGLLIDFKLLSKTIALGGALSKIWIGTTDYIGQGNSLTIDGNKIEAFFSTQIWKETQLTYSIASERMTSPGLRNLVNVHTSSQFSFIYPIK